MNPPPDLFFTAALLAECPALRAHAARLVRADSHLQDDAVQDALVAALEAPPPAHVSLAAWLHGVLTNRVRFTLRGEQRRRERERRAAESLVACDPAEMAARGDLLRRIDRAVAALDPATRALLAATFVDGLGAASIARRLGVPAATVRSRLKRALDRLRADLAPRPRRSRAMLVLLGLRRVPTARFAAACAALVCASAVAVLVGRSGAPSPAVEVAAGAAALRGTIDPPGTTPASAAIRTALPATSTTSDVAGNAGAGDAASAWSLRGRVVFDDARAPLAGWHGTVRARAIRDAWSPDDAGATATGSLRADGTFEIDLDALRPLADDLRAVAVDVDDPSCLPARRILSTRDAFGAPPRADLRLETELRLTRAVRARGRVTDAAGRSVAGASVVLYRIDDEPRRAVASAETDAFGAYLRRTAEAGRHEVVARPRSAPSAADDAAPGLRPRAIAVDLASGADRIVPDLALVPGVDLCGRLVDHSGAPIANAVLLARHPQSPETLDAVGAAGSDARDPGDPIGIPARTDAAGRFRIRGLAIGRTQLRLGGLGPGDFLAADVAARPIAEVDAPGDVGVVTSNATRVAIAVAGGGTRVAGAILHSVDGLLRDFATDENGSARIVAAPGVVVRFEIAARGFAPSVREVRVSDAAAEQSIEFDLGAPRRWPTVSLVLADGGGVSRCAVIATPRSRPAMSCVHSAIAEGGRFRFELAPDEWDLTVMPGADATGHGGGFRAESIALDLRSGADVELTRAIRPVARLALRAHDAEGRGLAPRCVLRDALGDVVPCRFTCDAGDWMLAGREQLWTEGFVSPDVDLDPGRCTVELTLAGYRAKTVECRLEALQSVSLDVEMEAERGVTASRSQDAGASGARVGS